MATKSQSSRLRSLAVFDPKTGDLHAIVDTPKGSRNKFKFDETLGLFRLTGVLPAGAVFPFDFGYVPSTLGEDGDPIDVLLLMDEPAFAGCVVPSRLLGVVEAEQTEDDETVRNDRLIAVASDSHSHGHLRTIGDVNGNLLDEIEHFFVSYNEIKGKRFEPLGRFGPDRARALVEESVARFRRRGHRKTVRKGRSKK